MILLGEHFRSNDRSRHGDWLRQQRWFIKSKQDREQRREVSDKLDEEITTFATSVIMATDIEITQFKLKLDSYDEATVAALMENQEQLDAVHAEVESMLLQAYVIEDGRRVFKTEDGTQVFDEFGTEIGPKELDFELIASDRPTWEAFSAGKELEAELKNEREQMHTFQEKVDATREEIADGDAPKSELDKLDAELEALMPPSVKALVPELDPATSTPDLKLKFAVPARSISQASPARENSFDPQPQF